MIFLYPGRVGPSFPVPFTRPRREEDVLVSPAMLGRTFLKGKPLDETVALCFRAPRSYTGEDVVELSVHGGTVMANALLEALYSAMAWASWSS